MSFSEKLEAALGSLKAGPGGEDTWLRPLEVDMSLGYAVSLLTRHALSSGYTRDEVAAVLTEIAVKVLKDAGTSH
ncbi:hypothetical protein D4A92_22805 (plasmid) [Rhizobium rosettiformans]|uniref:Uncharacterized protein n=1 Tax=Rhizobium rosettiformans TaxID=1368430 RepID=A0ABX7F4N9_9HYPH|nr:hypothetical protein [Rhizobium rosettiformans]QRF54351.1 hypothetical protein D4A92_22805 [Rhizobium rosettiformans]